MSAESAPSTPPCSADPELFFPTSQTRDLQQVEEARAVCAPCPLRRPCLAYALEHAVHGIWAGTTEGERRALQRAHGLPVRVQWSGATPASDEHDYEHDHDPSDFDDSED